MLIKVAAVQSELGRKLTLEERLFIFKQRPDFVCLPEYSLIDKTTPDYSRAALMVKENLEYLRNLSEAFSTCLIGGSVVEAEGEDLFNSAYLFNCGKTLGRYRKLNPVAGEIQMGITPGDKAFVVTVEGVRISILICADALNLALFEVIGREHIDIIFIPTTSPYRQGELKMEKFRRDDEIFVRAAQASSSYIVKTCGVGTLFGRPLQGRSLIASPWGILHRVEPYVELFSSILTLTLDIEELRDFRRKRQPQVR